MRFLFTLIVSIFCSFSFAGGTDSLIALLPKLNGAEKVRVLADITWELSFSDAKKAREYGEQGLSVAREINDREQLVNILNTLGVAYFREGRLNKSLDLWTEALELESIAGETRTKAGILSKIALIHQEKGNLEPALEMTLQSLKVYEALGDSSAMALTYQNLGSILRPLKQYDKMLNYNRKALELFRQLDDPYGISNAYGNLSLSFSFTPHDDSTIYYMQKALDLELKHGFIQEAAVNYNNLGSFYSTKGNYKEGAEQHKRAYEMMLSTGNESSASLYLSNYAQALIFLGEYNDAVYHFQNALRSAEKEEALPIISACLDGLADAYAGLKDYKQAYHFKSRSRELADSILTVENAKKVAELETLYETESKEKEITLLSQDKQIQGLKISEQEAKISEKNAQLISLSSLAALIVLSAIGAYAAIRSRQKKAFHLREVEEQKLRLKAVIDAQEKERARIAKDLHDGVGQLLSAAKMNYSNIQDSINSLLPDRSEDYAYSTRILDDACQELRTISHQMMPRILRESGLPDAIKELVHKTFSRTGIHCDFQYHNLSDRLPAEVEVGIYRIIQELISNILKHAEAKNVSIQLMGKNQKLVMILEDDGKGFDINSRSKGAGLDNIASRTSALNGNFKIEAGPVKGTVATVRVEYSEKIAIQQPA